MEDINDLIEQRIKKVAQAASEPPDAAFLAWVYSLIFAIMVVIPNLFRNLIKKEG